MSCHIPWAETAQLTEFSTETNYVRSLRECLRRYAELSLQAQQNALVLADAHVSLPGRQPTKILERPELETLLDLSGGQLIPMGDIAELIERRSSL